MQLPLRRSAELAILPVIDNAAATEPTMSGFAEDDRPRKALAHEIGQDLSPLSLEEIDRRIAMLKAEIERLSAARAGKQASKAAADAVFKL
jgi:uncharacterized small protein (DUF1192 family)